MNFWQILDNSVVWESSRMGLDFAFGLYEKRYNVLRKWCALTNNPSVLDIGCGIGQYSNITNGNYLGVDLNSRYISYATKRYHKPNVSFRCQDVTELMNEDVRFDVVLMVDFLHHIADEQCRKLLRVVSRLTRQNVVSFEPITFQPHQIGRWIIEHDRGNHIRPLDDLHALFQDSDLQIIESMELQLGPINTRAILARPRQETTSS